MHLLCSFQVLRLCGHYFWGGKKSRKKEEIIIFIQYRQNKEYPFSSRVEDWVLLVFFAFKFCQSNGLLHRISLNSCPCCYNWSCQILCPDLDIHLAIKCSSSYCFFGFFPPKMASKWNWNRHWKWLSLQFNRRKFDHQQPQWNERLWTISMLNYQHFWQYFKQRGCSSVCMWVIFFFF